MNASQVKKHRIPVIILLVWLGTVTSLSLIPSSRVPLPVSLWDKFEHAVAYAVLTLLTAWVLRRWTATALRAWCLAAAGAIAYGAAMEVAQALSRTGRHADFWDAVANSVGAGSVLVGYLLLHFITTRCASGTGTTKGQCD